MNRLGFGSTSDILLDENKSTKTKNKIITRRYTPGFNTISIKNSR